MKLYYTPGACSLSPHIILREAGYRFELEKVDLKTKLTETGKNFTTINEKGSVPFLVLDNGEGISEGSVIVQYLAENKPEAKLIAALGSIERVRVQEWLNYISTELHKTFAPLFANAGEEVNQFCIRQLRRKFDYVAAQLAGKDYLTGAHFTVADAYLFTVANWGALVKFDISAWPVLAEYMKLVAARPHVQEAMKAEGLLSKAD